MVTVEDALKSNDPKVIKKLRGSMSAQITCDLRLLNNELTKKLADKYNLETISYQLISMQKKKLLEHFDFIQQLHARYVTVRDEGENNDAEEALVEEDIEYMQKITIKVCPVLDELTLYEEAHSNSNRAKSLTKDREDALENCSKAKKIFELTYNKTIDEINKIEAQVDESPGKRNLINALPTDTLLLNMKAVFDDYKETCNKLKDAYSKLCDKEESKAVYDYDDEYAKYIDVEMKLKGYERIRLPSEPAISHERPDECKAIPIKINKPDNLTFSGQARDFASFKRDFLAIVVPNRDAVQIGVYLKQAIPEKFKYLVSNKDLHECRG